MKLRFQNALTLAAGSFLTNHWRTFVVRLLAIACLFGVGTDALVQSAPARGGTITGHVTDPSGAPLEGVLVTLDRRRGPSTLTDAGGGYAINGAKQKPRIKVHFSKEGYVDTQGITSLFVSGRLGQVTLDRVMLPVGATHPLTVADGGTVEEDGFKVTFPPGSLNAAGEVQVIISPIDVSSGEMEAFPGDFAARDAGGSPVLLETFSLMEITVLQNGQEVPLNPGMSATLEFLLPLNTSLLPGETVPLWYFDEALGLWIEDGSGLVGVSSFDPGRLSVVGNVTHFTWWNCDRPISEKTCLTGTVLDAAGNPAAGVEVRATGIDYNGTSYAVTSADGTYCVDVKRASQVSVQATAFGGSSASDSEIVDAPDESSSCATGNCTPVPDLTLPATSCISGDVKDAADNPVAGLTVTSSTGGFGTTDSNGVYCLPAPASSSVTLFAQGFPSVPVTTAAGNADCASGNCTPAPIRPAVGGEACLQITVIDGLSGLPSEGAAVTVFDASFNILAQGTTDANGTVCLLVSLLNTEVIVQVIDQGGQTGFAFPNTGDPASCQAGDCVPVEVFVGASSG